MKRKFHRIRMNKSTDNEYLLILDKFPPNHFIVGFNDSNSESTHCIQNNNYYDVNRNIEIKLNLEPNQLYRFCLVGKEPNSLSMDCISFYTDHRLNDVEQYKNEQHKKEFVSLIDASALAFLLGMGFTVIIHIFISTVSKRAKGKLQENRSSGTHSNK